MYSSVHRQVIVLTMQKKIAQEVFVHCLRSWNLFEGDVVKMLQQATKQFKVETGSWEDKWHCCAFSEGI